MANRTPTASGHDQSAAPGTVIALDVLFHLLGSGWAVGHRGVRRKGPQGGGGYLTLNGSRQPDDVLFGDSSFGLPIGQIGQWDYVVGPAGSIDTVALMR